MSHKPDAELQIDPIDAEIIAALCAGETVTSAAAAVGVCATTVYRRMSRPEFRDAYSRARAGLWTPDAERVRREVSKSIEHLAATRDDERVSPAVRCRAAVELIETALSLHNVVDVQNRLTAIESALRDRESGDATAEK